MKKNNHHLRIEIFKLFMAAIFGAICTLMIFYVQRNVTKHDSLADKIYSEKLSAYQDLRKSAFNLKSLQLNFQTAFILSYPGPPFETRDSLGQMIGKIRDGAVGSRLDRLKPKLPDLERFK